jgi:hypothetical protein
MKTTVAQISAERKNRFSDSTDIIYFNAIVGRAARQANFR